MTKEKLEDGVVYEMHTVLVPTRLAFAWKAAVLNFNEEHSEKVLDSPEGMIYMDGLARHHVT